MVLVRVRLVLGPLGPAPARGRYAHLRPPSCQRILKVSCQVLENLYCLHYTITHHLGTL
jgi:hypothetical protein